MDWTQHYPAYVVDKETTAETPTISDKIEGEKARAVGKLSRQVEVADIGCGFGGLLFALAPKLPESLLLGTVDSPRLGRPICSPPLS